MISQPAVSRALARLEKQVGAPLLHRTGRTLRMTQADRRSKPARVDALLHELDDGLAAVAQLADPDGTVALAFQHSLGTWLVPDLIRVGCTSTGRASSSTSTPGDRRSRRHPAAGGAAWCSAPGHPVPATGPTRSRPSRCDW